MRASVRYDFVSSSCVTVRRALLQGLLVGRFGFCSFFRRIRDRIARRRGNAILEFAFIFPVLLTLIGGTADFGLFIWTRSRLLDAVAYGAQYALLAGNVSSANSNVASAVSSVVGASFSGTTVTVTGPSCYCLSGHNPPTMTLAANCTTTCTGNSRLPGAYVTIQTSYTYSPIFPVLSSMMSTTMFENVKVRVE